jgi:hypothetical protein
MIRVINYADNKFKNSQNFAFWFNNLLRLTDEFKMFGPSDIDSNFKQQHSHIFKAKKGGGYWLWKPFIIKKNLEQLKEGDWLLYIDSGAFLFRSPKKLIELAENINQPVIGFELPLIEYQWSKAEIFLKLDVKENIQKTNQVMATVILIKNTDLGRDFITDYYNACSIDKLIDDSLSVKQNEGFIEHRHDQSIFSVLYKKYGFQSFRDISQRRIYPKSYLKCGYNDVKSTDIEYLLEDGRKFLQNTNRLSLKKSIVFFHKTNSPIFSLIKFFFKLIIGYNKKYKI